MAAVEAAAALKEQGNKAFKEKNWPAAIEFYSQAIEKNDQDPVFFQNRAQVICFNNQESINLTHPSELQANIKLEAHGSAIADATKAIALNPGSVKVSDPLPFSATAF